MVKIAFLFLVISGVNHVQHWHDFFKGHQNSYSIYVHAKNPINTDSFFSSYTPVDTVETSWANTMNAQIVLLKKALEDPTNEKFIFVSDATIPLHDFNTVYSRCLYYKESMFYYMPNPHINPGSEFLHYHQTERDLQPIARNKQFKNWQWIILNRKHAQLMVEDRYYLPIISQYPCDNEHYPSTFLINKGLIDEIIPQDTTYVEWRKPRDNYDSPYTFTNLNNNDELSLLLKAQKLGFLFARKLDKTCDLTPLNRYLPYRTEYKVTTH